MVKIKICGLTSPEDIYYVNEAAPDYIGLVFAKESKRRVSFEQAAYLKSLLRREIKAVGVFVNQKSEFISRLCVENVIDLVQLHGDEEDSLKFSKPVIKAMRIRNREDVLPTLAEYALFDSYRQGSYGGTGKAFEWELVKGYSKPFFLAGGLNEGNIEEAVKIARPYCVDVSGGVETEGKKDKDKIIRLVNMIRSMNRYE